MTLNLNLTELINKYIDGMNIKELAIEYNCSYLTIFHRLHDANVKIRPKGGSKEKLNIPVNDIKLQYLGGKTAAAISLKYNCSSDTIIRRLRSVGVKIRLGRKQRLNIPLDEIKLKYLSGENSYTIAKQYNCSVDTIINRLREAGIEIRTVGIMRGCIHSEEHNRNMGLSKRGCIVTEKTRQHISATQQGISYDEWDHFKWEENNWRDWSKVNYLNDWFKGCHRHHITKTIVIHIPAELHGHVRHCLKTDKNMNEINILSLQFMGGYYEEAENNFTELID